VTAAPLSERFNIPPVLRTTLAAFVFDMLILPVPPLRSSSVAIIVPDGCDMLPTLDAVIEMIPLPASIF
jgi:hypothetical protein